MTSICSGSRSSALATSRRFDIQVFVDKMSQLYELLVGRYRQVKSGRPRWDYQNDFRFLEEEGPTP